MNNITESLDLLRQRISRAERKYGREPGSVKLLAVSKTRSIEDIQAAVIHNQFDFGENYVQEAVAKITAITDPDLVWHFIGPVQSNKTREIATHFHWVHSIGRAKIAHRLNDARPPGLPPLNVCIQVNTSNENTKSGIQPAELGSLLELCNSLPALKVRGLMTLPAPAGDFEKQRQPFHTLSQLFNDINDQDQYDTLSMGTTDDFEAAIAEGATIIRIGTAIFGPRL